jgi:hypothetical protein
MNREQKFAAERLIIKSKTAVAVTFKCALKMVQHTNQQSIAVQYNN